MRASDSLHHLHDFLQVAMEVSPAWSWRAPNARGHIPPTIADLAPQEPVNQPEQRNRLLRPGRKFQGFSRFLAW